MDFLTAKQVAQHFGISHRAALALILRRHKRFDIGRKFGKAWMIRADELEKLTPDEKYRRLPATTE